LARLHNGVGWWQVSGQKSSRNSNEPLIHAAKPHRLSLVHRNDREQISPDGLRCLFIAYGKDVLHFYVECPRQLEGNCRVRPHRAFFDRIVRLPPHAHTARQCGGGNSPPLPNVLKTVADYHGSNAVVYTLHSIARLTPMLPPSFRTQRCAYSIPAL